MEDAGNIPNTFILLVATSSHELSNLRKPKFGARGDTCLVQFCFQSSSGRGASKVSAELVHLRPLSLGSSEKAESRDKQPTYQVKRLIINITIK